MKKNVKSYLSSIKRAEGGGLVPLHVEIRTPKCTPFEFSVIELL